MLFVKVFVVFESKLVDTIFTLAGVVILPNVLFRRQTIKLYLILPDPEL